MEIDRRPTPPEVRTPDQRRTIESGALRIVREEARAGLRDFKRRVALTREILNRDDRR